MFFISGKWYSAPLELNGGAMIPIFVIIFLVILFKQIKSKKSNWLRVMVNAIFLIYLWCLLDFTIFPIFLFPLDSAPYTLGLGKQMLVNFEFSAIGSYLPLQVIGNVLLLAPMSFFIAVFKQKYAYFRNNLTLMFFCTLGIEVTQLIMNYFYLGNRSFDVNDLILNTIGSILGFGLFKLIDHFFSKEITNIRNN